jgi:hypothetical protein
MQISAANLLIASQQNAGAAAPRAQPQTAFASQIKSVQESETSEFSPLSFRQNTPASARATSTPEPPQTSQHSAPPKILGSQLDIKV